MRRLVVALLFLAGLAATLALPGRPVLLRAPSAEEAAFAALVAGTAPAPLAPAERERLLATLRASGPAALARFLEQAVATSAGEVPRRVALECLAGSATGRELGALVRLATPPTSVDLRRALRAAVVSTLERDARAFRELVPAWRASGTELRRELLAAVAERGDPAGLELLAWVATFEDETFHRPLAEACLSVTPAAPGPEAREQLETLCTLLGSPDGVCVQTISSALARAGVETALPAWIELLASESRGIRERARRSLEQVTGLAFGLAPERWQAWYEAEATWYEEESLGVLAELEAEDDARVLAALRTLSQRRLNRAELALAIEPLLAHATPAVRLCATSALETLASAAVVPALVAALEDEDEAVARAVWSTLRVLTGLDLPLDPPLWRERFAQP